MSCLLRGASAPPSAGASSSRSSGVMVPVRSKLRAPSRSADTSCWSGSRASGCEGRYVPFWRRDQRHKRCASGGTPISWCTSRCSSANTVFFGSLKVWTCIQGFGGSGMSQRAERTPRADTDIAGLCPAHALPWSTRSKKLEEPICCRRSSSVATRTLIYRCASAFSRFRRSFSSCSACAHVQWWW